MTQSRRDFLKTASLVALAGGVPTLAGATALAVPAANQPGASDRILVVIQLHWRQRRPEHRHSVPR